MLAMVISFRAKSFQQLAFDIYTFLAFPMTDEFCLSNKVPFQPGSLFYPDAREPSMMSFRVPIFGEGSVCSEVLDGTFGGFS